MSTRRLKKNSMAKLVSYMDNKTIKKLRKKNPFSKVSLTRGLYKTEERVCGFLNNWYKKNKKVLPKILWALTRENKAECKFTRREKIVLAEFQDEIRFYEGKVTAYAFVLQQLQDGVAVIDPKKYPEFFKFIVQTKVKFNCTEPDCPLNKYKKYG